RRNVDVGGAKRTECREPPHELYRLEFTAKLQFEYIAHLHLIAGGQAKGLQSLLAEASHRWRQAAHSQRDAPSRPAVSLVSIGSAQNRRAHSLPVPDVTLQTHRILSENSVLD